MGNYEEFNWSAWPKSNAWTIRENKIAITGVHGLKPMHGSCIRENKIAISLTENQAFAEF